MERLSMPHRRCWSAAKTLIAHSSLQGNGSSQRYNFFLIVEPKLRNQGNRVKLYLDPQEFGW